MKNHLNGFGLTRLGQWAGALTFLVFALAASPDAHGQGSPAITSINPTHGPTIGGTLVIISGSNLGTTGTVTLGTAACSVSKWTPTQVQCFTEAGQGAGLGLFVTVANNKSNPLSFSYNPPAVTSFSPGNGPTLGGTSITLGGTSFGTNGTVTVGGAACTISNYSQTQIICSTPPGQGLAQALVVTVSGQPSQTEFFNYNPPVIASLNPATGPTAGGTSLTISGTNFGLSGTVTLGGKSCPISSYGQTQIACTIPAGEGVGLAVVLTVSNQISNAAFFNYAAPVIYALSPSNGSTAGGTVLTLSGINFGLNPTVTLGGMNCTVVTNSATNVVCLTPAGQGLGAAVQLTVGSQLSNEALFNYLPPVIYTVSPTNGPTAGGILMTISGTNFGSSGVVTLGGITCSNVLYGQNQIICTLPPGQGTGLLVQVNVSSQFSNLATFNYGPPVISSLTPTNGSTAGGTLLTLVGSNFGLSPGVTLGVANCIVVSHTATTLVCTTPAGQGTGAAVQVTVAGQVSNQAYFNYLPPIIYTIRPANGPTIGGTKMTITGTNFSTSGVVTLGGILCSNVIYTQNQIVCTSPAGQGFGAGVLVTVAGQTSNPLSYAYDPPVIYSISPTNGPTAGGYALTITGTNFGTSGTVTLGSSVCPITNYSQTQIVCTTPEGQGVGLEVLLTVSNQVSNVALFSYAPPVINAISPTTGSTAGGTVLTVAGINFGTSPIVTLGGMNCTVITNSATNLVCLTPAGQGMNAAVRLIVDSQFSNQAIFNYLPPVIYTLSPANGPTVGGTQMTITGTNFGTSGFVTLGEVACAQVTYAQNQIVCTTPAGQGSGATVLVTVSGQTSNPLLFNYFTLLLAISYDPPNALVSWPLAAADYVLEQAGTLNPNAWTRTPVTLQTNGNAITATIPASATASYFRLTKP